MHFISTASEPGDPEIADRRDGMRLQEAPVLSRERSTSLIVGCGPAGLTLAAQLSAFPDIRTCIVEQKSGPLLRGKADGIASRTMEMFEAYGFSERVLKEGCWINETTFWKPDDKLPETSSATERVQDTEGRAVGISACRSEPGAGACFLPRRHAQIPAALEPYYARRLLDLEIDNAASGENADPYQVTALDRADRSCARRTDRDDQGLDTWWVATARAAPCASPSARTAWRLRQSRLGRDWTSWPSPTSRISASSR